MEAVEVAGPVVDRAAGLVGAVARVVVDPAVVDPAVDQGAAAPVVVGVPAVVAAVECAGAEAAWAAAVVTARS